MGVNYKPLWKKLIDLDMQKQQLAAKAEVSISTIAKMGRGEYVALEIIERICRTLKCKIGEVVEFPDETDEKE